MTPFPRRCQILAGLWQHHRNNRVLSDFVETNDLGLPLAFSVYEGLALPSSETVRIINSAWDSFEGLCSKADNESNLLADLRLVLNLSRQLSGEAFSEGEQTMFANWLGSLDADSLEISAFRQANA